VAEQVHPGGHDATASSTAPGLTEAVGAVDEQPMVPTAVKHTPTRLAILFLVF
jgi:hypothetical protein